MILLFGHQKGGVGKSTIAINFAYKIQKIYKDLILLDLDSQNSAMLFNQLRMSQNLPVIQCVKESDIAFNDFINKYANDRNNLLIVDSGGYDSDINRAALIRADIIITPVGISQIEIFGLQKFRKILKEASEALGKNIKTNVLINNVDSRSKAKLKDLQEYIKNQNEYFNLLNATIHARADFKNSYGDGLTIEEFNNKSIANTEVEQLVKEVIKLINN